VLEIDAVLCGRPVRCLVCKQITVCHDEPEQETLTTRVPATVPKIPNAQNLTTTASPFDFDEELDLPMSLAASRPTKRWPVLVGTVGALCLAIALVAGFFIFRRPATEPEQPPAKVIAQKSKPPAEKRPKEKPPIEIFPKENLPLDPPDRVEANEWERTSQKKLDQALLELGPDKTHQAKRLLSYPLADIPRKPTKTQMILVMELSQRLGVIAMVEKDEPLAKRYLTMVDIYRRKIGWPKDRFDEWEKPILRDTARRMGIK
jgi:hypothetical protein